MADGTSMKQLKAQVNQVNSLVSNLQTQMEALEVGSSKNQEGIQLLENKLKARLKDSTDFCRCSLKCCR